MYKDGTKYDGEFDDDEDEQKYTGENATLKYGKNEKFAKKFVGTFEYGFKSVGLLEYKDGSSYEGEFTNDKCECEEGTYIYKSGDIYVGPFKNGTMDGVGTLTKQDDTKYEIKFDMGKKVEMKPL